MEIAPITIESPGTDFLAVMQIRKWTITKYGEVPFRVLMDEIPVHSASLFCSEPAPSKKGN